MNPSTLPAAQGAPLVLVVDNDLGVSTLLQEVLARCGLRTAGVADGVAALRFLEGGSVSLVVCDLDMPEMGGLELLDELERRKVRAPVLIVSGYLDGDLERRLADRPSVVGVFRKPFDVFVFAERAREVLVPVVTPTSTSASA
ncbi:MAG: response regulator [Planctomycetota bacterium]